MLRKRGRPLKENSKRGYIHFRTDGDEAYKLHELSEKLGTSKSDVMRKAIDNLYRIYKYRD